MAPKTTPSAVHTCKSKVKDAKKRFRLIPFLTFFFLKALCTLVMLNFYMASHIELEKGVLSIMMQMHRNSSKQYATVPTKEEWLDANSTTKESRSKGSIERPANSTKVGMITPNLSDGTLQGKERLWKILQTRNVTEVDAEYWASIPSWETVLRNLHHDKDGGDASPIIHGLETCQAFRDATSSNPSQRRIAPAGLFNTGTNYLSVLLEYNCQNPHRVEKFHGNAKRGHGNEWEVPWGKHTPASSRGHYLKNPKIKYTVDDVLPVVLIRNPYGWMKSMCRNPYTASWKGIHDKKTCPQLKEKGGGWNNVDVKFGSGSTHHQSLGHLWNDWYGQYFYSNTTNGGDKKMTDAPFPRLMIRFEDIIYFPYEVTKQVCECAGGVVRHRPDDKDVANGTFHYVVRSAKAGFGHGPATQRNGLIDSWARYGSGDPKEDFSEEEVENAMQALDPSILSTFGYR